MGEIWRKLFVGMKSSWLLCTCWVQMWKWKRQACFREKGNLNLGGRNILKEKKIHRGNTLMLMNGGMTICCRPFWGLCLFLTYSITKCTPVWRTAITDIVTSSSSQLQLFHSNCQCIFDHNFSSIDTTLFYRAIISNLSTVKFGKCLLHSKEKMKLVMLRCLFLSIVKGNCVGSCSHRSSTYKNALQEGKLQTLILGIQCVVIK